MNEVWPSWIRTEIESVRSKGHLGALQMFWSACHDKAVCRSARAAHWLSGVGLQHSVHQPQTHGSVVGNKAKRLGFRIWVKEGAVALHVIIAAVIVCQYAAHGKIGLIQVGLMHRAL